MSFLMATFAQSPSPTTGLTAFGGIRREPAQEAQGQTLYIRRPLINAAALVDWAKAQGFPMTLPPEDMHVTIAYSKEPLWWTAIPPNAMPGPLTVRGGDRSLKALGDKGAIVLRFESPALQDRWAAIRAAGASWDFPSYQPHVTLTYLGSGLDLETVEPYAGPLQFGDEIWEPVDAEWQAGVVERAYDPSQPRDEEKTPEERQREWDDLAQRIADDVDFGDLGDAADDFETILARLAGDSSYEALVQIGADDDELVDVVNEAAEQWARKRAAELVGMRRTRDGGLAPSRNSDIAITESTRNSIREIIANGLRDNIGSEAIANNIETAEAFSAERASLVAMTEVANANSAAAVIGYKEAEASGIEIKKEWLLAAEDYCPICEANAAQGPIPVDEPFQSGHMAPIAHPNCRCAVSPVVGGKPPP